MRKRMALLLAMVVFCLQPIGYSEGVEVNLQQMNLTDAIHILANAMQLNVLIDPAVKGVVNLHLKGAATAAVLDGLLSSYHLSRQKMGDVWLIAPSSALEASSPLVLMTFRLRYAKAQEVANLLRDTNADLVSKRGWVKVDARTNTVFIHDTKTNVNIVQSVLAWLDVPVQQIRIEVRIASVDDDHARDLGIRYATTMPLQGEHTLVGTLKLGGAWLDAKLSALEQAGHAQLLSRPSLFTTNQQAASIEAGEEIPYQEVSESGGTAVVFKKAVLALKVTPQVMPGGQIRLHMQINQDRPNDKLVHGVPTISTRQIMTDATARNGETIVLGGIYEISDEKGYSGLPFVSKLPLVGALFRDTQSRQIRRELLIFVTPKIMKSTYDK